MIFQKISNLEGELKAPPSKSLMIRAIAAGLLSEKNLIVENFKPCEDSETAISVAEKMGAKIKKNRGAIIVDGKLSNNEKRVVNCRQSALTLRLFSAIAAISGGETVLQGEGSLTSRPVKMMGKTFSDLGVEFSTQKGVVPVRIKGPIKSGKAIVEGSESSQFLSGLLMTLPVIKGDSLLFVNRLKSTPYIDMTIEILDYFGIDIENRGYEEFFIRGGQKYGKARYVVEGDWSGASFPLVMGALKGKVGIRGLNPESLQGDRRILTLLKQTGSYVEVKRDLISVKKDRLKPFTFNASDCPDLFPPLVVLASGCIGKSYISGAKRLKFKESNRSEALIEEFGKIGVRIELSDDNIMEINGTGKVLGGSVSSHGDHRIAMALISASVISDGEMIIDDVECINKSYPGFFDDLSHIIKD